MKKSFFLFVILFLVVLIFCGGLFVHWNTGQKDQATIDLLLQQYGLSDKTDARNVLTVGAWKRFSRLSSAVNAAEDGDVIIVFSGEYVDSVDAASKTLYIIGENRSETRISYPNSNYFDPPIEMGSGLLANMTVYASHQEIEEGAVAKAYALHTDFDISKNTEFQVKDVHFINESYQAVGIGLRENFTLHFQNCFFECTGDDNAFYCHDDPTREGSVNQRLIVENCHFVNNGINTSTILMQSQEASNSEILCEWKNNTVENKAGGKCLATHFWNEKIILESGWLGMSFWKNSENSNGNNLVELNSVY